MSLKILVSRISKFYWVLLIPAGALTFVYSWLGFVGTGFGSSRDGTMSILLMIQPLLAFPLFLVAFFSLRLAVRLLWVYVAGTLLIYVANSWPRIGLELLSSRADRWLLIAVVLMQAANLLKLGGQRPSVMVRMYVPGGVPDPPPTSGAASTTARQSGSPQQKHDIEQATAQPEE